ncbi:uncharacterized protein LOC109856847 [Pseudomyrmex gracilis]|uniref:uncharacterized protein LOC109856847 n=1 Tax=Pseudomyrmex gracilis TaxID=219809 RepID=UPI000995B7E5|nr:uncharacterized protein LOC109856847 [Pseudomyrmex gracilis]
MAQRVSGDASIFSKFNIDASKSLDYNEFRLLCCELFDANVVEQRETSIRAIFKLFDADADGVLNEQEIQRCCDWIRTTINPVNILIIVDVQNDFIDGTLSLRKYNKNITEHNITEMIDSINVLLQKVRWDKVIYTQDWHPENHISFFENLPLRELDPESQVTKDNAKLFDTVVFLEPRVKQTLWPKHCVKNTWGADLHKDLLILPSSERLYKGCQPDKDVYSGFNEKDADGSSVLARLLPDVTVAHLYVCGIAYDVCVKETCLDGLRLGYRLAVIDDCCRGIKPDDITIAKQLISENGGLITTSKHVFSLVNDGNHSLVTAHHAAKMHYAR